MNSVIVFRRVMKSGCEINSDITEELLQREMKEDGAWGRGCGLQWGVWEIVRSVFFLEQ